MDQWPRNVGELLHFRYHNGNSISHLPGLENTMDPSLRRSMLPSSTTTPSPKVATMRSNPTECGSCALRREYTRRSAFRICTRDARSYRSRCNGTPFLSRWMTPCSFHLHVGRIVQPTADPSHQSDDAFPSRFHSNKHSRGINELVCAGGGGERLRLLRLLHDTRTLLLAVHLVLVVALQSDMDGLHRGHVIHGLLHGVQRLMLLAITTIPNSHLTEAAEILAHNVQIDGVRF